MQTKNPRIKFYRSWAINDTASLFQYEMGLKEDCVSTMK